MGCGATAQKGKYATTVSESEGDQTVGEAIEGGTCSGTSNDHANTAPSAPVSCATEPIGTKEWQRDDVTPVQEVTPQGATMPAWQLEELDKDQEERGAAPASTEVHREWWSHSAEWIQQKSDEILAAYNFFFEHIGLRKGWRTAPFEREEVQAPFLASAEVVTLVRAKLDEERGKELVLRQLEGSAMNFLWGWPPVRRPGSSHEALEDFFRGLVYATLSDARGLVEGLDRETVEHYVCCHPLLANRLKTDAPPAATDAWSATT